MDKTGSSLAQRDYKPRQQRKPRPRPGKTGPANWAVFAVGFVAGAGVSAAILRGDLLALNPDVALVDSSAGSSAPAPAPDRTKPNPLKFEFYSLLPEAEIVVPESELARERAKEKQAKRPVATGVENVDASRAPVREAQASTSATPEPAPAAAGPPETGTAYLLQVGSFRKNAQAEQLRAKLALLGLEPRVETVNVNGKATWHRVRLGPFRDVKRLDDARERLGRDGVQSLVIKGNG